jgi:PAS domain S-box-containing protein
MPTNNESKIDAGDILIVDDEIPNLQLLTQVLSDAGYQALRSIKRPKLAIESALAQPPSLILLDVRMPEMDGFEVCRRLKEEEQTRDIPIIFVSALQDVQDRVRGFEAGGVDFISKPFQEKEVLARVQTHLALRNTQLHLEDLVAQRTAKLTVTNKTLEAEIGERKKAEDELRRGRDYLKNLTNSMGDAVFSVKMPERKIEWINDSAFDILGYDPEELIGKTTEFLYPNRKDFLDFGDKLTGAVAEGKDIVQIAQFFRRKSGETFPVEITLTIHKKKGEVDSITGIVRDITERKQMEEAIKESEERYRGLSEAAFEAIFISEKGVCLEQNSTAEKMFGYTLSEAIGRKGTEWVAPEDREMVMNKMLSGYEEPYETTALRKDGSTFPAEIQARTMHYKGRAVRVTALNDITERKRANLELKQAYDEIRQLKDRLEAENLTLRQEVKISFKDDELIGKSHVHRIVLQQAEHVAPTDSTVLILGETGTGKGLIARRIHQLSGRKDRLMVNVNCAALPATLIESEFFGHEKGAFTGATDRKIGRFELADGGTIFLDEIGDLPIDLQAKLLRILQDHEFERLGSSTTRTVDTRIIAATNRDLDALIEQGAFRTDLYYRLGVFPIRIPPLRERRDDIPLLVWFFITMLQSRLGKTIETVSSRVMDALTAYDWPGNVRELSNIVERAMILSPGARLELGADFPWGQSATRASTRTRGRKSEKLDEVERAHIVSVLKECGWKVRGKGGAAERLGLKRTTLQSRMKKLGIQRPSS